MKFSVQDQVLRQLISAKSKVCVFTTNGFQVNGVITHFDRFAILVSTDKGYQLMYKHAISTITCGSKIKISTTKEFENDEKESEDEEV